MKPFPRLHEALFLEQHFGHKKMLFLAGPRQVGKTFLARQLLQHFGCERLYFNWDDQRIKRRYLKSPYFFEEDIDPESLDGKKNRPVIVFDEIHKRTKWKNYLKGVYDRYAEKMDFIVTGSGRLNIFKRGSDSLFGRYFMYQLHPLSLNELLEKDPFSYCPSTYERERFSLSKRSVKKPGVHPKTPKALGLPGTLFKNSDSFFQRWQRTYDELVLQQDVRDLSNVRDIAQMEQMMMVLPERIGSPLSINALSEDIGVSFKTMQNWIHILDRVYYLFPVMPWSKRIKRSLKKERKVYFWNWCLCQSPASKFENFMACQLKKTVLLMADFGFGEMDLYFCRSKDGVEVDFLITQKGQPRLLIEVKLSETSPVSALAHFMKQLNLKVSYQVVLEPDIHHVKHLDCGEIHIISANRFLTAFF